MTQTQIPTRPHQLQLRKRAERLIAAFDATPEPRTLTDMLRTARLLMALDRMLTQLWKEPAAKATRPAQAPTAAVPAEEAEDAPETAAAPARPLNRRERRAEAARQRTTRPPSDLNAHRDTG